MQPVEDVLAYFGRKGAAPLVPINDTETEKMITTAVLLSLKWAAEIINNHPLPRDFLTFIMDKCNGWMGP